MTRQASAVATPLILPLRAAPSAPPVGGLRGEWVRALLEGLQAMGIAAPRRAGPLGDLRLREPLCRVPLDTVATLLAEAARSSGDPLVGLRLAQRHRPLGLFHYLLASQENLGAAIATLSRHADALYTGAAIDLAGRGETRTLRLGASLATVDRRVAETCLAIVCLDLREVTHGHFRCEEVRLRGRAVRPAAEYEQVFGCPVRFAQPEDALVVPAIDLRLRLRRRNRHVAERLERAAQLEAEILGRPTARERVETILRAALQDGHACRRAAAARRLVCSSRALRRALEAEGTSFREIEAQVRRQVALALVGGSDLSLAEVAARCGFAGLAAFSKAFRRWTVCAPSAFRERQLAARGRRRGASRAMRSIAGGVSS